MSDMEKLVIFDFTIPSVDIYDVDSEANIDEEYLENLGYSTNNCQWMFGDNMDITFHKEILR